jgi:hypothetical protein
MMQTGSLSLSSNTQAGMGQHSLSLSEGQSLGPQQSSLGV